MLLRQKRDVSTGRLLSSWAITFFVTAASDAFWEHSVVNHLSAYIKLCTRIIPVKWMELFMCLKLDTCLNVRQDEAHNPLNMIFSSCTWSLVSENTYCHRALHGTLTIFPLCTHFKVLDPGSMGKMILQHAGVVGLLEHFLLATWQNLWCSEKCMS